MKGEIILVVEDDLISCELFKELFERERIESFIIVHDGEHALEICKEKENVQLILMDYKLPGMDGCETLKEIRKFRKDISAIMQTACVYEGDLKYYTECGFNDYLSKPIDYGKFEHIINKYYRYTRN